MPCSPTRDRLCSTGATRPVLIEGHPNVEPLSCPAWPYLHGMNCDVEAVSNPPRADRRPSIRSSRVSGSASSMHPRRPDAASTQARRDDPRAAIPCPEDRFREVLLVEVTSRLCEPAGASASPGDCAAGQPWGLDPPFDREDVGLRGIGGGSGSPSSGITISMSGPPTTTGCSRSAARATATSTSGFLHR